MILKVEDELNSLGRTDPDCDVYRDPIGLYSPPLAAGLFIKENKNDSCV